MAEIITTARPLGIMYTSTTADIKLGYEDNITDNIEYWWVEKDTKTVLILTISFNDKPAILIHRLTLDDAIIELQELLNTEWKFLKGSEANLEIPND